jgi:hypothetical protein
MQFRIRHDKEDMAQPITPVLKYEEKIIEQLITQFRRVEQLRKQIGISTEASIAAWQQKSGTVFGGRSY